MPKALDNLRSVDFSRIPAGLFARTMLADLGATVTKIERPDSGDDTRSWRPPHDENGQANTGVVNTGVVNDLSGAVALAARLGFEAIVNAPRHNWTSVHLARNPIVLSATSVWYDSAPTDFCDEHDGNPHLSPD